MSLKANIKMGSTTIQVEADNVKDLIKEVSFFNELPHKCQNCSDTDLGFRHRSVSGNEYYELVCNNPDCGFTFPLGQHKDNKDTLFPNYTKGWQPPYKRAESNS